LGNVLGPRQSWSISVSSPRTLSPAAAQKFPKVPMTAEPCWPLSSPFLYDASNLEKGILSSAQGYEMTQIAVFPCHVQCAGDGFPVISPAHLVGQPRVNKLDTERKVLEKYHRSTTDPRNWPFCSHSSIKNHLPSKIQMIMNITNPRRAELNQAQLSPFRTTKNGMSRS
jgi:hypothetical protein